MDKYIVNNIINGYSQIVISDKTPEINDSAVVCYVDKAYDEDVATYYNSFLKMLHNRNRIYLIGKTDDSKIFTVLASLIMMYNDYDIYTISNKNLMTKEYVDNIIEREPDYQEAQTYLGGDTVAYSNLSHIMFGLESLVSEGDANKIKMFVENNIGIFENITHTVSQMKKKADLFNSDELIADIKELKEDKIKLSTDIDNLKSELKDVKHDNDNKKLEIDTIKRDYEKLKDASNIPVVGISDDTGILSKYTEIKMQNVRYTVKGILYFKEISYVRYTNTMIMELTQFLRSKNIAFKLIIYDSKTDLSGMYKPLNSLSGSTYSAHKQTLLNRTKTEVVIGEPGITLLNDVITTTKDPYDLIIVYDRVGYKDDIISGNNVAKFFVVNSVKEYNELQKSFRITNIRNVITSEGSTIGKRSADGKVTKDSIERETEYLYIPTINGFNAMSDSQKLMKYVKTLLSTNKSIIAEIIERSNLSKLIPKLS